MTAILVAGTNRGQRRCDSRCHMAAGLNCECVCDGRYHGCARASGRPPENALEAELMARGITQPTAEELADAEARVRRFLELHAGAVHAALAALFAAEAHAAAEGLR